MILKIESSICLSVYLSHFKIKSVPNKVSFLTKITLLSLDFPNLNNIFMS